MLGKKVLFIEAPSLTKDKIIPFVKEHNIKKAFCLSPIDYKDSKYPNKTNQKEYEKACLEIYSELKKNNIKIIPHVHLDPTMPYKPARDKIIKTIKWFKKIGVKTDEICFGWWLECYNFNKICEELNIKASKRQFHFYDFWIVM